MIIRDILLILAFCGYTVSYSKWVKKTPAYLPMFLVCLITDVVYLFGLAGHLDAGVFFVTAMGTGLLLYHGMTFKSWRTRSLRFRRGRWRMSGASAP